MKLSEVKQKNFAVKNPVTSSYKNIYANGKGQYELDRGESHDAAGMAREMIALGYTQILLKPGVIEELKPEFDMAQVAINLTAANVDLDNG